MLYPAFIGGSYESQAVTADQERTVNWYVERMESKGATTEVALYPTPGVLKLSEATTSPGRAHFAQAGREFAVIGATLYEIASDTTMTSRGTVATDGNPATICSNGAGGGQLFITSGTNGYIYDLTTNTLTQVAALNGKATMGDMLDGYFLALDATVSKFYRSNLLDGLTWSTGTNYAQRSKAPDPWISMKVVGQYIWLLGQETSESWYNDASTFSFAPHPSGLVQWGCAATFSPTVIDGALVWLAADRHGDGYVLSMGGFAPEVISTYALRRAIDGYATISNAEGNSYKDLGHTFYLLSFPSPEATWAWDTQTGVWHERGTWIAAENRYVAWRPRWHQHVFGQHRWLDSVSGAVYRSDVSLTDDVDGRIIRRLRRAPGLTAENQRIFYAAFEVDLEPGLGSSTGQGANPQVMLRQSNDGGKTWGNERLAGAGKIGEYARRVRWNRCGMGRRMVFEVSVSDPIPWRLTGAYLTLAQSFQGAEQQAQQAQAGR